MEAIREEIVQLLSKNLPPDQVKEIRHLLAEYFAKKATEEFDKLAEEKGWTNETYEDWLKERMRIPYSQFMRIVLDKNILLVSIGSKSLYRPIFDAILSGRLKVLLTTEIYLKYLEKIGVKTKPEIASNIVRSLLELESTELITVHY